MAGEFGKGNLPFASTLRLADSSSMYRISSAPETRISPHSCIIVSKKTIVTKCEAYFGGDDVWGKEGKSTVITSSLLLSG
ncbi:uncharacterized protein PHALS_07689 [Plasmopara halstedii]|uniref:Uncharacterized protein n=1 Tax=Plasmopara halstedii TaxID=4781 RepID=A0A0P1B585_PLAHL|nr:uncharacterized protein PHALS_07689 [Plasmopara halstedii]CEG49954.1 hypothetical protein PHALS_07689 [Plasmopara halstedii]|eukprot:XP_024586323.1 hypothetical protein PHALS_07689 [Plasmopara halstedii]